MERFVMWYRGEGEKTLADVASMLPAGADLLKAAPACLFLVRAERSSLEHVFARDDGWFITADELVSSTT
jgi:hypothetical protein